MTALNSTLRTSLLVLALWSLLLLAWMTPTQTYGAQVTGAAGSGIATTLNPTLAADAYQEGPIGFGLLAQMPELDTAHADPPAAHADDVPTSEPTPTSNTPAPPATDPGNGGPAPKVLAPGEVCPDNTPNGCANGPDNRPAPTEEHPPPTASPPPVMPH